MAFDASVLRARVQANLHNDYALTTSDYDYFLTLGQQRMVMDAPWALGVKEGTISVEVSTRVYALASDFYQMRGVFCSTETVRLAEIPHSTFLDEVESLSSIPAGAPEGYCITGISASSGLWEIAFDRIPSTTDTYKYWYYWTPEDVTATATPVISAMGFANCLIWAATMIGREANDPAGYQQAAAAYDRELVRYRAFHPAGPDHIAVLNPSYSERYGSTLTLPDDFPED